MLLKWISDSLKEADKESRIIRDELSLRWVQGEAQCLNEIIQKYEEATKEIEDIRIRESDPARTDAKTRSAFYR